MTEAPASEPFYLPLDGPDGERFHATSSTTGPWFAEGPTGLGTVSGLLFDTAGHVGRSAQELVVRPR